MQKTGIIEDWLKEEFIYVLNMYVVLDEYLYPISELSKFYSFEIEQSL
jgi:hypothetical protein